MDKDIFYLNRIIKIISPFTFQTFKIELNGEEDELRDLLATILEINPNSIKGLRDSYNNYYTLSSAVKNPHINTNQYNYYTVVIKESNDINNKSDLPPLITPSYNNNFLKNERMHTLPNENNINYHTNFLNNTYNFYEDNNNYNQDNINNYNYSYNNYKIKKDINDYLNFADDLHTKNYLDNNLIKKLKKLILQNNKEVLSIMSPYINIKSRQSYDEFTRRIIPIISYRSPLSENLEHSKYSISSEKDKKSKKKGNLSKIDNILEDIKKNVSKKEYSKLKKLLKNKDKNLMKIIKNFQKNKDFDKLISKLTKLVKEDNSENSENTEKTNKKEKDKNEYNDKDIKKIEKSIINSLKKKGISIDIYYIAKYDLQKLNKEEKISLFKKKFKLKLESILNKDKDKDNYKIPKKNITIIKDYYTEYINKKIKKDLDENENILYEGLLEQEEDNNYIIKYYKDFLKHKNLNELKNNIKQIIKETVERIELGEGEEEEEDDEDEEGEGGGKDKNEGKTLIKEENEEEEEEEDEGGEEEEDEKSKNDENKSSTNKSNESNDNIIILKDDNKDRAVNLLNNNYRKINNFNYNNNDNSNNDKNKEDNNDKNKGDDQNLGLGFVVVKPKKSHNGEDNKDNNNNKAVKDNNEDNKQNESSVSTNNPNKKLNQFIQQIEHLKKIDDIKETIIEAINNNNKYIMDLFQKFQKNKFCLNPKSLNAVYKQIKENPEINNNSNEFKTLIKDVPDLTENIQEFLCYEFNNQNSELETYYNLYKENKEKSEFIESIELFMKKPNNKKLLDNFNLNSIKKEIEPKLSLKNNNLVEKSKEIIKIFKKYKLFNDKEINIIQNSLESGENIITAAFQVLFDNKDFDEFYETITIAIGNQIKKGGNKK